LEQRFQGSGKVWKEGRSEGRMDESLEGKAFKWEFGSLESRKFGRFSLTTINNFDCLYGYF
jgi:hypothetical protein